MSVSEPRPYTQAGLIPPPALQPAWALRCYGACVDDPPELHQALGRLLPQLSSSAPVPAVSDLERIVTSPATTLFVARTDGVISGVLTLVVFQVPTGVRALIEDVEPKTLEALAFAAGGSVGIQIEMGKLKLQELGVTYWPDTAQALVADLLPDMRPPH